MKHVAGDRVKQNLTPEIEDLFSFFKPMVTSSLHSRSSINQSLGDKSYSQFIFFPTFPNFAILQPWIKLLIHPLIYFQLTENVVVTFDEPNLLMNPVLFVAHERKITGSMKEFLLLDGSKHEVSSILPE